MKFELVKSGFVNSASDYGVHSFVQTAPIICQSLFGTCTATPSTYSLTILRQPFSQVHARDLWHGVIELLHIECVLLYSVSQKSVSTKWRIYKGKLTRPRISCYKNNVRNIQNGGFVRAKSGPLIRHQARILYLLILCMEYMECTLGCVYSISLWGMRISRNQSETFQFHS